MVTGCDLRHTRERQAEERSTHIQINEGATLTCKAKNRAKANHWVQGRCRGWGRPETGSPSQIRRECQFDPCPQRVREGRGLSPKRAPGVLWVGKLALEETGGKFLKRKTPFTNGDLRVGGKGVWPRHLPRKYEPVSPRPRAARDSDSRYRGRSPASRGEHVGSRGAGA